VVLFYCTLGIEYCHCYECAQFEFNELYMENDSVEIILYYITQLLSLNIFHNMLFGIVIKV